jgi:hypothetical protein
MFPEHLLSEEMDMTNIIGALMGYILASNATYVVITLFF